MITNSTRVTMEREGELLQPKYMTKEMIMAKNGAIDVRGFK